MRAATLLLAAVLLTPLPAAAQSWCSSARLNPTEATICAHSELGRLDARLSALWSSRSRSRAETAAQRDWLSWGRDACGRDGSCIAAAYGRRIADLSGIAYVPERAPAPAPAPEAIAPAYASNAAGWCRNAGLSGTESAICTSYELSELEAEMDDIWNSEARDARARADQRRWLFERRNPCGSDRACIVGAYLDRIDELIAYAEPEPVEPPAELVLRRPWCGASRLTVTEETICDSDILADLDARLAEVYGAVHAEAADRDQIDWVSSTRDACGRDFGCIVAAYRDRIALVGGGS